jgi:hypothetical protein
MKARFLAHIFVLLLMVGCANIQGTSSDTRAKVKAIAKKYSTETLGLRSVEVREPVLMDDGNYLVIVWHEHRPGGSILVEITPNLNIVGWKRAP